LWHLSAAYSRGTTKRRKTKAIVRKGAGLSTAVTHRPSSNRPAFLFVLVVIFLTPSFILAQTIRVAAASDLQFAVNDLSALYQKQTNRKLLLTFGSSGNFYAQILNGAPFDLLFSADIAYPQKLIDAGRADSTTLLIYARGQLVLWATADAHLNLSEKGFAALRDSGVQRIVIANPAHAPYGRAAVAALQRAGLYDELKSKLVYGENISQAAQFAQSGSAQVGILSLSLSLSPSMKSGDRWLVPSELYPALDQAAVLLTSSANKPEARAFLEFVKSDAAREVLVRHGFITAEPLPAGTQKP
jgi:molybdate transport system substrate-binding protein